MSVPYRDLKKLLCASALLLMFGMGTAIAQSYPNKPIKFIVGFGAGGPTDIVTRVVANHVSKKLGQPTVVENHTGANGMVAAAEVARAEPDGYTVLVAAGSTLTLNPLSYKKTIQYKVEDFAPVSLMVQYPFLLLINPENEKTAGVKTLQDLMKLARSKPGQLTYGSSGLGGLVHLLFERLHDMAGVKMVHIPYRGSKPAQLGLLSKEVDVVGDNPSAIGLIKAGKLKALATTLKERWWELPDVPTVDEIPGFKGYEMSSWVSAVVPARTPPAIVKILSDAISSGADDPATKAVLAKIGNVPMLNPQQFAAQIKAETEVNAEVMNKANIKLD